MIKSLRLGIGFLSLAAVALCTARSNTYGGYLDSSENLYTASNYPSPIQLRVLRRDANGGLVWNRNVPAPAGYEFGPTTILKTDSSGNLFVGCIVVASSGTAEKLGILRFTPSGSLTRAFYYAPSSFSLQLEGLCLDGNQNVYAAAQYATSSTSDFDKSFILQCNNPVTVGYVQPINAQQYGLTLVTDLVADSSTGVYAGSLAYNAGLTNSTMVMTRFDTSTFLHGPTWQRGNFLPSQYEFGTGYGNGCLTLDGAGRLDFVAGYHDKVSNSGGQFVVQRTTADLFKWSKDFSGVGSNVLTSIVDSGGNLISVEPESSSVYQMVKFTNGGSVLWSVAYSGVLTQPESIALDASGRVELVDAIPHGSTEQRVGVQLFDPLAGSLVGSYYYEGAGLSDYGRQIFASRYTPGTFYISGTGIYQSNYYPLNLRFTSNGLEWAYYQIS